MSEDFSIPVVGLWRFVTLCNTAPYRNSLTYLLTYTLRTRATPERLIGVSRQGAIQIQVYLYLYFTICLRDKEMVYLVVCLFSREHLLVLIVPSHETQ